MASSSETSQRGAFLRVGAGSLLLCAAGATWAGPTLDSRPAAPAPASSQKGNAAGREPASQEQVPAKPRGAAPQRVPVTPQDEGLYFQTADANGDGWLSFGELEWSFQVERDEFQLFDPDRDGRSTREEFSARFLFVLDSSGWFPPPRAPKPDKPGLPRNVKELLEVFDRSGDAALDVAEATAALEGFQRSGLSPQGVVALLDRDRSRKLYGEELQEFFELIVTTEATKPITTPPTSVEELFGQPLDRSSAKGVALLPPRIAGPVPYFRRLDLNGNGFIELADLEALQAPLILRVRPAAVLGALDQNGDGKLDRREMERALGE
jgi:hypothetical protein